MHFARTFSIMRAYGVRLTAIAEARNYGKIVYIKNIFENGWWEEAYPSSCPPESVPGQKVQKPSKERGIFQLLGIINFVIFYKKTESRGEDQGGGAQRPLSIRS